MRACCLDPRAALATLALLLFGGPAARPLAVLAALAALAVLAMLVSSFAFRASRSMITRFLGDPSGGQKSRTVALFAKKNIKKSI